MPENKISSPNQTAAVGMGTLSSNMDAAIVQAEIGGLNAAAIEDKENRRQRMYEVAQDSLKTIKNINELQEREDKIKRGYKNYQLKTGHGLDYDKITAKDVIDDPSLWRNIGDVTVTDVVTGQEFTPAEFAAFEDFNSMEKFKDIAASISTAFTHGIKPSEYGKEYVENSFGNQSAREWALIPENNEILARIYYGEEGLKNWAGNSEVVVMKAYATDNEGTYSEATKATTVKDANGNTTTIPAKPASITIKGEYGNDIVLTRDNFKTGKGVEFDKIKGYLSKVESLDDPNHVTLNDEKMGVTKDMLYYGTEDLGLYGMNTTMVYPEDYTYTDGKGFSKKITTNKISRIENKDGSYSPDRTYKKIQSAIALSQPGTEKEDIYQRGGMRRFLGKRIGDFFKRDKDEDGKLNSIQLYEENK